MDKTTLTWIKRIAALLICLVSAGSLLVSGWALLKTWEAQGSASARLLEGSAELQNVLDNTAASLDTTGKTISATVNTLKALRPTLLAVAQGSNKISPALDELQTLTGESLPQTITATQTSLYTAQQSAAAIEAVLRLLSQIPFFPTGEYNPPVSLEDSLGYVADDLEALREPLESLQTAAKDAGSSLDGLDNQIIKLILLLDQIRYSLEDTNRAVAENRDQILQAKERLAGLDPLIAPAALSAAGLLSFILVWLGLVQASWLVKGISWIYNTRE